ncbi:MAG: cell division protein FtsQ/DivIB [Actinomycetota bacterium]
MADDTARRGRSRAALPVVIAVAVALLSWAVLTSPVFEVQEVVVRGNVVLTEDRVIRLSGAEVGDNLLLLSAGEVVRRLRVSPWVATADVQRSLPSTLVLTVTERTPVAWIEAPEGRVPVAGDGTVLGRRDAVPRRLPSLGVTSSELAPGTSLPGDPDPLRVAASLPEEMRGRVRSVTADGGEVLLRLWPRGRVLYGTVSAMERKNVALAGALRWAEERDVAIAYVDVRVPERPALRPVGEPPVSPSSVRQ